MRRARAGGQREREAGGGDGMERRPGPQPGAPALDLVSCSPGQQLERTEGDREG